MLSSLHVTDRPRLHRGQRQVARQWDDGRRDVYIHHWYLRVGIGLESRWVRFTGNGIQDAKRVLLGAHLFILQGTGRWQRGCGSRWSLVVKHSSARVHAGRVVAQGLFHDGALVGDWGGQRHVSPSSHDAG